jgi:hypothetical protein
MPDFSGCVQMRFFIELDRATMTVARLVGQPSAPIAVRRARYGVTTFEQLASHGPFAPIVTPLLHPRWRCR